MTMQRVVCTCSFEVPVEADDLEAAKVILQANSASRPFGRGELTFDDEASATATAAYQAKLALAGTIMTSLRTTHATLEELVGANKTDAYFTGKTDEEILDLTKKLMRKLRRFGAVLRKRDTHKYFIPRTAGSVVDEIIAGTLAL